MEHLKTTSDGKRQYFDIILDFTDIFNMYCSDWIIERENEYGFKRLVNYQDGILLNPEEAMKKCMTYSEENTVECCFRYDTDLNRIYTPIYYNEPAKVGEFTSMFRENIASFHTHPYIEGNLLNEKGIPQCFFGIRDLIMFFDYPESISSRFKLFQLGCPEVNRILTLKTKNFMENKEKFLIFRQNEAKAIQSKKYRKFYVRWVKFLNSIGMKIERI